jgi:hypothetical protein
MDYFLTILIASMAISSSFIGIFRLQASSKKEMTAREKLTFNWWMPSVYDKELARKAISTKSFNKYWFFVQVQKISLMGIIVYC